MSVGSITSSSFLSFFLFFLSPLLFLMLVIGVFYSQSQRFIFFYLSFKIAVHWFFSFHFSFCSFLFSSFCLILGYFAHFFSSFLRCKIRLLIWDLSSFLTQAFNVMKFPLCTALPAPDKFGVIFLFSSTWFPWDFLFSSLIN